MKQRINIMLSDEAIEQLNKQPNRSQYIENLILGGTSNKPEPNNQLTSTLDKIYSKICLVESYINSDIRSTTNSPIRDCTCPYDDHNNLDGMQVGCPVHDPYTIEDLL